MMYTKLEQLSGQLGFRLKGNRLDQHSVIVSIFVPKEFDC